MTDIKKELYQALTNSNIVLDGFIKKIPPEKHKELMFKIYEDGNTKTRKLMYKGKPIYEEIITISGDGLEIEHKAHWENYK